MAESTEQRADRFNQAARQERLEPPEIIQADKAVRHPDVSLQGFTKCYIAKVSTNATGGGYYNCYLQSLDATDWNTTTANQLSDVGSTVVVLNLPEIPIGGDTASHKLSANDLIMCWKFIDDSGNAKYIGIDADRYHEC